jgi:hypothetical protein
MIGWIILSAFILYFLYTRIWVVYRKIHFYKKQGVPFHSGIYPVLGSFIQLKKALQNQAETGGQGIHLNDFVEEVYCKGNQQVPPIVGVVMGTYVGLFVNTPELCEEVFVTKNKYFDKHPRSLKMGKRLFGDSILFAKSDILWQ